LKFKRILSVALSLIICLSVTAFAAEEEVKEIRKVTYEEAVERAVKYNSGIATINESITLLEKNKESLVTNLDGLLPVLNTPMNIDSALSSVLTGINTIDRTTKKTEYQKTQVKESMELMVKNYFNTIYIAEKTIELAKENLHIQQINYSHSVIKHNLGMISDNAVKTERANLENIMQNLKMAELSLDSSYDSLGNLISMRNEDFVIDYELEFKPLVIESGLEGYIANKAQNDPSVKIAEAELDSAEYTQMVSLYDTTTYGAIEKQNAVNSAERKYVDTVNSVKTNIRTGYNTIMQLEANHETLLNALNEAETTYKTCEINYQIGNITELQLKQAALGVKNAEINILSNISNHDLLVFQFYHPYMFNTQK